MTDNHADRVGRNQSGLRQSQAGQQCLEDNQSSREHSDRPTVLVREQAVAHGAASEAKIPLTSHRATASRHQPVAHIRGDLELIERGPDRRFRAGLVVHNADQLRGRALQVIDGSGMKLQFGC
jgi:hypothetical protein